MTITVERNGSKVEGCQVLLLDQMFGISLHSWRNQTRVEEDSDWLQSGFPQSWEHNRDWWSSSPPLHGQTLNTRSQVLPQPSLDLHHGQDADTNVVLRYGSCNTILLKCPKKYLQPLLTCAWSLLCLWVRRILWLLRRVDSTHTLSQPDHG